MRTIYIDCAGVKSAADLWQRYLDAANPPDATLFGRNLDAFWDAIESGGPGWPGKTKLIFTHTSELAPLQVGSGASLLTELSRITSEMSRTQIELT